VQPLAKLWHYNKLDLAYIRVCSKHIDRGLHSPLHRRDEDSGYVQITNFLRIYLALVYTYVMQVSVNHRLVGFQLFPELSLILLLVQEVVAVVELACCVPYNEYVRTILILDLRCIDSNFVFLNKLLISCA